MQSIFVLIDLGPGLVTRHQHIPKDATIAKSVKPARQKSVPRNAADCCYEREKLNAKHERTVPIASSNRTDRDLKTAEPL